MKAQPRYLLDTSVVSDLVRYPDGPTARKLLEVGEDQVALSVIVSAEIRFDVARGVSAPLEARLEAVLDSIPIIAFEPPADVHYADIRQILYARGTPIGPNDLLIAAQGRALGMTVVTDNQAEFSRVPGLNVENWRRQA